MRVHPEEWSEYRQELIALWKSMHQADRYYLLESVWDKSGGYAGLGYASLLAEKMLTEVVAILPRDIRWGLVAKLAEMAGLVPQAFPLREAA